MRPQFPATRHLALCALVSVGLLSANARRSHAQTPPPASQTPPRDTTHADTTHKPAAPDTNKLVGNVAIPGLDLPVLFNLRIESKSERDRNLRCNSAELAQVSSQISSASGCNGKFLFPPNFDFKGSLKSAGTIGDRFHVNVDYDMQREFDASNTVSLYYQGKPSDHLQRVDVGNIEFTPPPSRFLTSSLPSGNYGLQSTWKFGAMKFQVIGAKQTGNVVQSLKYTIGAHTQQETDRDVEDYQVEARRFFFTIDPKLLGGGKAYPNIDILNRSQLQSLRNALPDTLRPTRVLIYRLQFGTQPQNPNGPQFRLQGDVGGGRQTYDLLREGVDYYMDPSMLWFALVRELNPDNERLVVAYNVKINGRDTVWVSTGGTPDLQLTTDHDQVANLIMDPSVGPTSPAFDREIRSVYRLAGEDLIRSSAQVRVVAGSGSLEHPLGGNSATFLQMFGLAQANNAAEFDYDNRIWPRVTDPVFNLSAGAPDARNGQSLAVSNIIRDYFIVLPSLRPFSARDATGNGGLVTPGNPTNDAIYTIPGEYLNSPQRPTTIYRLRLRYRSSGTDEGTVISLGASQMRRGSERVLLEGKPLVRDMDYRIDYDLGRIEFMRPDTLFRTEQRVEVRYEDNPTFAPTPTTLAGFVSELPVSHGSFALTAIDQSQSTPFNRPELGFQGNSMLTTGVTGQFAWEVPALTSLVSHLPFGDTKTTSHFAVQGELANSHPQFLAKNQGTAYVESFEGTNGLDISMGDISWDYSSMPAYGHSLNSGTFGSALFEPSRASTLVWQSNVKSFNGQRRTVTERDIDPLVSFSGTGAEFPEPLLWLTLLPLDKQGDYNQATRSYDWTLPNQPPGRRWRSIRTVLRPAGVDLTGDEQLEFWTLADTSITGRAKNPTLVFDFGDVSENSLRFGPDTLRITHPANAPPDSTFAGKKPQGFDRLDTERDKFSHTFNADVNDTGLPGDVVDSLVVIDGANVQRKLNVPVCHALVGALDALGDPRTDCTVGNRRLDEEDIDLDNALNFTNAQRENERLLRYVVDLSDPAKIKRVGGTYTDTLLVRGAPEVRTRHWVLVSIPFKSPTDSLNDVNRRRIRALRLTVVSGNGEDAEEPTQFPLAELRVTGAPWLVRSSQGLQGIAGIQTDAGFVIASSIGTNDSTAALAYQPPPGVTNQPDSKTAAFSAGLTQDNEHAMRIQAGNLLLYHRAEAYYRFPSGPQYYMGFQQLRVWTRGHGDGWGDNGDLQMYIKVGRDENNFYMYRAPAASGQTAAAWTDVGIDFSQFISLRAQIQKAYLAGKKESIACTGVDSAIIAASPLPAGVVTHRFAACANGYMVYTIDPAVTAPNLASVQELAVGMVRVGTTGAGSASISPGDTLELWVDDIRLDHQVNNAGTAGQFSISANAGGLADLRINVSNRDPNFRQLADQPTFLSERDVDVASTINLERLLPPGIGISMPLTITKTALGNDPLYLTQTDIPGASIPGVRKPETDLTTYSLSVRRTTHTHTGIFGSLIDNLSATGTYTKGVDRTEYQDGNARNFTGDIDYLMTSDTARTLHLPTWANSVLGSLPSVLQAGPIGVFRGSAFRWNPTQLRFTTGIVDASDRRLSYVLPGDVAGDSASTSVALSRLWRNGSVLELRPTNGLDARWEIESVRDLRDYGDTSTAAVVAGQERRQLFGANAGFESDRSMTTSIDFSPAFSAWFRPRAEIGAQYSMLRDPNTRSLVTLPGVVGVDSVIALHDSLATASAFTLPRRMIAAQTLSAGTNIDVARAFTLYSRDSTMVRRIGKMFAPIDVSYTRSLLSAFDASAVAAPLSYQFGLGGVSGFRSIDGVDATTAGETGMLSASGTLLLPYGTSIVSRVGRTTTENWIARPDDDAARVDGVQNTFPDLTVHWTYRPAAVVGPVSNVDATVGYQLSDADVSLPSLTSGLPPEVRHTHVQTFPIGGTVVWSGPGNFSTGARYSISRRVDSLPGSLARSRGDEMSADVGRSFKVPASWGLGVRNEIRARAGFQQSRNTTNVLDATGSFESRLQDNGRQSFNLTADTNLNENLTFTLQGSHIVTFDNNLNRKFSQTVFSTVLALRVLGGPPN
ncbi:MAG TPA: cell surface protein SprA [Gemmatimonadaceae bacterium]